jgi:hypothetical protein
MASQQVKRAAELQDLEVRAEIELARSRVRAEVFASGRHDSIQQARARQQAIFHPRQLFPANFFVNHGISSSSSFSLHRSCSPWEITFCVFSFITKATPRFALIH